MEAVMRKITYTADELERCRVILWEFASRKPRPLGERIAEWMSEQECKTGKRPTFTAAGEHFGVHRTTAMRNLKKHYAAA